MAGLYFIGSGALLSRAVAYAVGAGLPVAGVCHAGEEPASARLRQLPVAVLQAANINADLALGAAVAGNLVLSINNPQIIGDALLSRGAAFFNIHNGLTQHYRGRAEVCLFAALCRGETEYGATLHQILPGQKVDRGPVVAQARFAIAPGDTFASVLPKSLDACQQLFEAQVRGLLQGSFRSEPPTQAGEALGYRDVARLCAAASMDHLRRASALGPYASMLPRLALALAAASVGGAA